MCQLGGGLLTNGGCTFSVFYRGCIEVHGRYVLQGIRADAQSRASSEQQRPTKACTDSTGCTRMTRLGDAGEQCQRFEEHLGSLQLYLSWIDLFSDIWNV